MKSWLKNPEARAVKIILPWILAAVFAAAAGRLLFLYSARNADLAKMGGQLQQMETLQSQADALQKQAASQKDEIASLRKDNEELLRLRNEARQLRDENQKLAGQLQASQAQAARSQTEARQAQTQANETAIRLGEQQILQMKQDQENASACINNLKLIQQAKEQWAQDRHQPPDAVPTPQDLVAYLPDQLFPQCPAGGHYSINAVSHLPTCSIPGHVLQ